VTLKEMYYILEVVVNLFSVRRATEEGSGDLFEQKRCCVKY
jgi:hypothetical protein